jgi:hypothetical protein
MMLEHELDESATVDLRREKTHISFKKIGSEVIF